MTLQNDYSVAIQSLNSYLKWYSDHRNKIAFEIAYKTYIILDKIKSSGGYIKHLRVDFAGVKNTGIQIWAWQRDDSLPASMAHFTNILLITVDSNGVEIIRYDLKPSNVNGWRNYDTTSITNESEWEPHVNNAIRWLEKNLSQYPDYIDSLPWHKKLKNRVLMKIHMIFFV